LDLDLKKIQTSSVEKMDFDRKSDPIIWIWIITNSIHDHP